MQATFQKADLLKAIQTAERAVATKSSLPILSALMLQVSGPNLTVQATDLEVGMTTQVPVTAGKDGAAAVPGKQFVDYVRAMPGAEVTLTVADSQMVITSGKSRFKLAVIGSHAEFPVLAHVAEPVAEFQIDEAALRAALERAAIAASTEDTRPILTAVLWRLDAVGGQLTMVATDTHRLHLVRAATDSAAGDVEALVPGRACKELIRLLGADANCSVRVDRNQIEVKTSNARLTSRLIEGQFPKFEKVVPDLSTSIGIDRDDFAEVITRAGLVGKDDSNRVVLSFQDDGSLRVNARGGDGEAEEEIGTEGVIGDQAPTIAANCHFLLQAIQACPDDTIRFLHSGDQRPTLLHGDHRDRFLAVVMPMTLK
jgi:DNA polymerase-3 subunit beta